MVIRRLASVATVTAMLLGVAVVGLPGSAGIAAALSVGPAAASAPNVPSVCAPRRNMASAFNRAAAVAARRPATTPLKDLAIEPQLLTVAQWTSLLNLAGSAGANVITVGIGWSSLEPNGPAPANEWTALDSFVAAVRARGMAVRFQIAGFPNWARDAGDPTAATALWQAPASRAELTRWSSFISRLVGHFGTSVAYYEIWNEENLNVFWSQGPNPTAYANLLECSYVAAKKANPKVTIVSGGLSTNDIGYLTQLYTALDRFRYAASDNHFFDVLGEHPYSSSRAPSDDSVANVMQGPFGPKDQNFLGFMSLHTVMSAHGEARKKIYIGEFGYPVSSYSADQYPGSGAVTEAQRAAWLPQAYRLAGRTGQVVAMSWYIFYPDQFDTPAWALVTNPNGTTAATTQWQITPSFRAFASVP
jgi:polysaccharide biosynthesis protein PslG